MLRTIGWQELVITGVVLLTLFIPTVIGAIAFYRIAQRAGYEQGVSVFWAIGYAVFGWLAVLLMGFLDWPRDSRPAYPPPPASFQAPLE